MSSYHAVLRHAYTVVYGGIMFKGVPPPTFEVVWVCEPPLKLTVCECEPADVVEPLHLFAVLNWIFDVLSLYVFASPYFVPFVPTLLNTPLVSFLYSMGVLEPVPNVPVTFSEPPPCE